MFPSSFANLIDFSHRPRARRGAAAAVEVRSGATIADPFVPTSAVVELLGLRAAQVRR